MSREKESLKKGFEKMTENKKVCPIMSKFLPITSQPTGINGIQFFEKDCIRSQCQLWAEYGGYCRMGNT